MLAVLRLWLGLIACCVLLAARDVRAEVIRYALIIGNNVGSAQEGRLRYAERDAEKVRDTLLLLGGFKPENTVTLLGQGADEVQRVLISLNARVRAESSGPRDSTLLVYYSGHADGQGLHLGNEVLDLSLLKRLVQGSAAAFRVLLLDACQSGALTRVKGASPIPAFDVSRAGQLSGEGLALLTSSAADEDAQESDLLQGSFFTHYLVSGLRGAADKNQNGNVTIEEVYDYAYRHTLDASSRTRFGLQHPTFAFDLRGKGGIPITWVGPTGLGGGPQSAAFLEIPSGREYLIFVGDATGPVIAEVGASEPRRRLALAPGRYFVRGRAPDFLLEGQLELRVGQILVVPESSLERVQYARLARKGLSEDTYAHGPWLSARVRSALWPEASACPGLGGGYAWELSALTLSSAVTACRSTFENAELRATADEVSLSVEARYVVDLRWLSLGAGLALGGSWLRQSFATEGVAPTRNTAAGFAGPTLTASAEVARGWYWLVSLSAQLYVFEQQQVRQLARAPSSRLHAVGALSPSLGVGKYF